VGRYGKRSIEANDPVAVAFKEMNKCFRGIETNMFEMLGIASKPSFDLVVQSEGIIGRDNELTMGRQEMFGSIKHSARTGDVFQQVTSDNDFERNP
jgi:hypothetical protein